jgi:predicted GH43/DUF377 family glycosyl hydrolase
MRPVPVTKTSARFLPDPTRVITKPFAPGSERSLDGRSRVERILSRILALSESEVTTTLGTTQARFAARHVGHIAQPGELSAERRLLIGAYFTQEYSIESAALTNPSMVPAPDQEGLAPGEQRFVLSLRAIGEGHISSIEFRSGVIDAGGQIEMEAPSRKASTARHRAPVYEKHIFYTKLRELDVYNGIAATVLDALPDRFTLEQLETTIREVDQQHRHRPEAEHVTRTIHWLASSNYESSFAADSKLSERVLFPAGPTESQGMEDARFVRFTRDDGTATLNGASAKNKGIALFPRMIDGRYAALSRLDNENNFLMWSDNVRFWYQNEVIQTPERPWEITQLGNCGSPLETEAGWIVITHGVGALRQYALGAILLDKEDPARVIGHLAEPLLEPADDERDGYVPNVVYSCGSMISGGLLVLPYGFSDVGTRIATVRLDDLLAELTRAR